MDFVETITLEIPDIQDQLNSLQESKNDKSHALVVEIAALHEGTTANFNHYGADTLEGSLESWVTPYPKPVLLHHEQMTDPIGRVMASKMDQEDDGTPYTRLQVAITDPEAVTKVSDGRYLTCSVGGKALEANCSICSADWSNASMFDLPCKHRRGNVYKGETAKINFKKVAFKEISFVNSPADSKSGIRPSKADITDSDSDEESDGWVHARVFDINMDKEEIVEFTESETRNVLSGMRKKDSSPLYLQLKGAFLSALAVAESDEENHMSDEEILEEASSEEDDVLLVSEELSSDLAQPADEEPTEDEGEPEEGEEDVEPSEEDDTEEDVTNDGSSEEKIAPKPEGQEKPTGDVDPELSTNVPLSRQSDEEDLETEEEESEESSETELNDETESPEETVNTLESRVEELETQNQTLSEENARLRSALKRGLAERVVDTKIALRLAEQDERDELLEEHLERSSRSLADSLRDLASMKPRVVDYADFPTIEGQGVAVLDNKSEEPVITIDSPEENHIQSPEDIFVDAFMGRRKL